MSKVVGKTFLLQVYDYAMNVSTYKVSYDFLPDIDGYYTFFDLNKKQWYTYTEDGSESAAMGATNLKLYAAEYADGYVFAIDEKNALYVMPDNDFANVTKIADLGAASGPLSYDFFVSDMAYNAAEKEMYFLAYSEANELGASYLFKLDLLTGATSLVGEMGKDIWTLASRRLQWLLWPGHVRQQALSLHGCYVRRAGGSRRTGRRAVHLHGAVLAGMGCQEPEARFHAGDSVELHGPDPQFCDLHHRSDDAREQEACGSFQPVRHPRLLCQGGPHGRCLPFCSQHRGMAVSLSESTLSLLVNEKATLTAQANPWTLSDRSVTWSSSDDSVVTVKNGVVTGVGEGSAVITGSLCGRS